MKNAIISLLKLKSILSLMFCITSCYLAVTGKLEMETFMAITMSIVTYYFTRKEVAENNKMNDNIDEDGGAI